MESAPEDRTGFQRAIEPRIILLFFSQFMRCRPLLSISYKILRFVIRHSSSPRTGEATDLEHVWKATTAFLRAFGSDEYSGIFWWDMWR